MPVTFQTNLRCRHPNFFKAHVSDIVKCNPTWKLWLLLEARAATEALRQSQNSSLSVLLYRWDFPYVFILCPTPRKPSRSEWEWSWWIAPWVTHDLASCLLPPASRGGGTTAGFTQTQKGKWAECFCWGHSFFLWRWMAFISSVITDDVLHFDASCSFRTNTSYSDTLNSDECLKLSVFTKASDKSSTGWWK